MPKTQIEAHKDKLSNNLLNSLVNSNQRMKSEWFDMLYNILEKLDHS